MAGKKKTMGRGLGSLLERRSPPAARSIPATEAMGPAQSSDEAQLSDAAPPEAVVTQSSASDSRSAKVHENVGKADSDSGASATVAESANTASSVATSAAETTSATGDKLRLLGIDQIQRGAFQPRRHFDHELLQELSESLKSEGLIQPVLVRPNGEGRYELIAGERRWRAAQLAGFTEIPSIVRTRTG